MVAARLGVATVAAGNPVFELIKTGVLINVALAVFNMVPLPPLDGSWVASWGLPRALAEPYDRVIQPYGQFILLALFVTGILSWVVSPVIGAILQFLQFLFRLAL
jgi:Zn-dependent protease